MDYIRQINAFENWNEYNEIGPGAQLLWYKLMRVANLSGWQNELSISNTRLQSMTKSSEKTLINNRNQLIQSGLLQYKKRGRTKAGIYIITDISTGKAPVNIPTTGNIPVDTSVDCSVDSTVNSSVVSSVDPSAYIKETKLNKTKPNIHDDDGVYPAELIQRLYGQFPTGILQGAIANWLNEWPSEMICLAIQSSYDYGKPLDALKPYINQILKNWISAGIDTPEKVKAAKEKFQSQKQKSLSYNKPIREEKLPDWAVNEQEEAQLSPERQAELDAKLAAYLNKTKH